jgi:glycosyltransferase involved in cell wall biosynthesis
MKISIYQPRISYYKGGGEVVPIQQAKWLAKRGHEVSILTVKSSYISILPDFEEFCKTNNIKIDYLELPIELKRIYDQEPGKDWTRWDLESLHVGRIAYEFYLKNSYDIVAVHNLFDAIAVPVKQKNVMHLHGTPRAFEHHHLILATLPKKFISVSDTVGSNWQKILPEKSHNIVIKNGVDTEFFSKTKDGPPVDIFFVGRLLPVKGIDTIIEAVSYIKRNYGKEVTATIAGTGTEEVELKNLVAKLGLEKQIEFLGYVDDSALPYLYSSAQISVFPSKDKEGVLTTMLEAASCSRPIISTTVGGIPEFLKNEYNGLLVPPSDITKLGEAIYKLLSDTSLQHKLAKQARLDISKDWSWESRAILLEHEYERIVQNGDL